MHFSTAVSGSILFKLRGDIKERSPARSTKGQGIDGHAIAKQ